MTQAENIGNKGFSRGFNRFMYAAFTLLALIKLPFHGLDESWTLLGIALLFDPFDPEVRWDKRPWYQRAWLVIHLVAMLVLGSLALLG
jgi:hypothetical protein